MSIRNQYRVRFYLVPLAVVVALFMTGCRLEMYDQAKVKPLAGSSFFADSQASREYIPGTVPRQTALKDHFHRADLDSTAIPYDASVAIPADSANPYPLTRPFLVRGSERFNIYCSPCHGRLGDGEGMIVKRGMPHPPTYHSDRLRGVSDAYIYGVITNGFGVMYGYASRIPAEDRWAIIGYLRALQLSQNAPGSLMPKVSQTTSQRSGE